jgi:hypothetical protein
MIRLCGLELNVKRQRSASARKSADERGPGGIVQGCHWILARNRDNVASYLGRKCWEHGHKKVVSMCIRVGEYVC